MRNAFFEELDQLYDRFLNLGYLVKETMNDASQAFADRNVERALEIIEHDQVINDLEGELEKDAIQIIALQQPVTKDLRRIITVIKAGTDLERIADHARGVAYATKRLESGRDEVIEENILKMVGLVDEMFGLIMLSLEEPNVLKAIQAAKLDDEVDKLNKTIAKQAAKQLVTDGETSSNYIEYRSIASDIERIGDYLTNIGEVVIYLDSGENFELNPRFSLADYSIKK